MPWAAAAGVAGAGVLGGLIGNLTSASDRAAAQQAAMDAYNEINSVGAPPDLAKQILLQHFQSAGVLTPQLEQAVTQQASQLGSYKEDPSLKNAQLSALSMLQQRGQTGLSPEDRAAFNQVRNQVAQDTESKRQQIMQNFQARGQGGSGSELAAALNAASQGQQNASEQGDRLAGLSSQRALEALVASGQLGGQIRGQDFGQAQAQSSAQDAINRFNAANAQAVQGRNVGNQNAAQQYNLQNNQNIMNANTQMANQEQLRQAEAQRQYWQDQMAQAQAKANAKLGRSGVYQNAANQNAQMWQGLGQGVSQGVAAGYQYQQQQNALNQANQNQQNWQSLYSQQYGLNSPSQSQQSFNSYPSYDDSNTAQPYYYSGSGDPLT